jgi:hypothetical protein
MRIAALTGQVLLGVVEFVVIECEPRLRQLQLVGGCGRRGLSFSCSIAL